MSKNTIGTKIRGLRKNKGLTQKELGEIIGVSRTTINKYEGGYFTPSSRHIKSICKALECEEGYLCEVENDILDKSFIDDKIFDYLLESAIKIRYPEVDINSYEFGAYKRNIERAFKFIDDNLKGHMLTGLNPEDIEDEYTEEELIELSNECRDMDEEAFRLYKEQYSKETIEINESDYEVTITVIEEN